MRLGSPGETLDQLEPFDSAGVSCDPHPYQNWSSGLLLDQRRGGCPVGRGRTRRAVLRLQLQEGLQPDHRLLRRGVRERPDAQPLRPLQRLGSSSASSTPTPNRSTPTSSPAGTTPGSTDRPAPPAFWRWRRPLQRPVLRPVRCPAAASERDDAPRSADTRSPKSARWPRNSGCRCSISPTRRRFASSPDNDYAGLVERRREDLAGRTGDILDTEGAVVGKHEGQHRFTIGQRRGVGVALGYPIYVVDKDPESNTITVGDPERLMSSGCTVAEANWLVDPPSDDGRWAKCLAQVRYNSEPVPARVRVIDPLELPASAPSPSGRTGEPSNWSSTSPSGAVTPGTGRRAVQRGRARSGSRRRLDRQTDDPAMIALMGRWCRTRRARH